MFPERCGTYCGVQSCREKWNCLVKGFVRVSRCGTVHILQFLIWFRGLILPSRTVSKGKNFSTKIWRSTCKPFGKVPYWANPSLNGARIVAASLVYNTCCGIAPLLLVATLSRLTSVPPGFPWPSLWLRGLVPKSAVGLTGFKGSSGLVVEGL